MFVWKHSTRIKEQKMKKMMAGLLFVLAVSAGTVLPLSADDSVNVFDSFLFSNWLTQDQVNFGNLTYSGTYTVLFFWQQRSS